MESKLQLKNTVIPVYIRHGMHLLIYIKYKSNVVANNVLICLKFQ